MRLHLHLTFLLLIFNLALIRAQDVGERAAGYAIRAKEAREEGKIREALYWYRKGFQTGEAKESEFLPYARTLHSAGLYDEAIKWYEKYQAIDPNSEIAANGIKSCTNIRALRGGSRDYRLYLLPGINSEAEEWGLHQNAESLMFFSNRNASARYFTFHHSDGSFSNEALPFEMPGLSDYDIHPDSSLGVFLIKDTLSNRFALFFSQLDSAAPPELRPLSFPGEFTGMLTPRFSPDGRFLFFAAQSPKGKGGFDIWSLPADSLVDGKARLLKGGVNTEGDERLAGFAPSGELYFASNGLPGLGGFDLFAVKIRNGKVISDRPRHLGEPVNSGYDELEMSWSDSRIGFLTSNRPGSMGRSDIFSWQAEGDEFLLLVSDTAAGEAIAGAELFKISTAGEEYLGYSNLEGKIAFLSSKDETARYRIKKEGYESVELNGTGIQSGATEEIPMRKEVDLRVVVTLVNRANGKKAAGIGVSAASGDDTLRLLSDDQGKVRLQIEPGSEWEFSVNEKGYLAASETLESESWRKHGVYRIHIPLNPLIKGRPIVLENILFKYKSTEIDREASKDLEKLLDMLIENPDLVVEVSTHTDSRGGFQYNEVLSQKRAQAVVDWLITRGVAPIRLVARGYGEYHLLNECADSVPCPEWKHRQNRRAEIKILGTRDSLDGLITAAGSDWDINPDDIPLYVPDSLTLVRQAREGRSVKKEEKTSGLKEEPKREVKEDKSENDHSEIYMVQFAASTRAEDRFPAAERLGPLAKEKFGKYTRFMIGPLTSLDQAYALRTQLRAEGFKDAFIVAYRDGKRLNTRF